MARKKPETHEAEVGGRKQRVTIPQREPEGIDVAELCAALQDNLSPHAVAAIGNAVAVQANDLEDRNAGDPLGLQVVRELRWFAGELDKLVGGDRSLLDDLRL